MFDTDKSVLQKIDVQTLNNRNVELFVKRDDLIDELVSGNKWRKLKYNIAYTKQIKKEGILTFGGAFSNHLIATAAACKIDGIKSVGIVRGNELTSNSNETLQKCAELGMKLIFVSREEYNLKNDRIYHEELAAEHANFHIVPEGGSNYYGMIGCQEILTETPNDFDHVFVAQGTTTTSLGILLSLPAKTILHVVPALKGFNSIEEMRSLLLRSGIEQGMANELLEKVDVLSDFHFGGYGKYTKELLEFMETFFKETKLPLDPVYTGKTLFALMNWIEKNEIRDRKVLFVHTGGIQGGKLIAKKEGSLFY